MNMFDFSAKIDKATTKLHILDWVLAFASAFYTIYICFTNASTTKIIVWTSFTALSFVLAWINPGQRIKNSIIKKTTKHVAKRVQNQNNLNMQQNRHSYNVTYSNISYKNKDNSK